MAAHKHSWVKLSDWGFRVYFACSICRGSKIVSFTEIHFYNAFGHLTRTVINKKGAQSLLVYRSAQNSDKT